MPLTGPEKAVLMLLSLDETSAAPIVSELDEADLRKLREVAAMMRAVPASAVDDVYAEFVGRAKEAVAVPRGGVSYLKRLASRALGEGRSNEIFTGGPRSGMERIALADPGTVAALLENEHPQLVAAVLSQLETPRASAILEALPAERQGSVLARLGTMTDVPAGILDGVATAIAAELPPPEAEASMSVDGVARAAAILRKMDKQNAAVLLTKLTDEESQIAAELRRAMYTFEDLKSLDSKSFRVLLKEVAQDRLVLALKTASEAVKQKIFAGMSTRAAQLLRDDLEALGGVRLVEVEMAQREIVEAALKLEAEGRLSLGDENDLV